MDDPGKMAETSDAESAAAAATKASGARETRLKLMF